MPKHDATQGRDDPGRRSAPSARGLPPGVALLAGLAMLGIADAAPLSASGPDRPRRVLVVESFGRDLSPLNAVSAAFRTELARRSRRPVEFSELALQGTGLGLDEDAVSMAYVRAFSAAQAPDLVVTNGGPAARFWARYREGLLPRAPVLYGALDERHVRSLRLGSNDCVVADRLDLVAHLGNVLALLPSTRRIWVVVGDSPLEEFWEERIRAEWGPHLGDVKVAFLSGSPFERTLDTVSALPSGSAIFFLTMLRDSEGVPWEQSLALRRLHERANAPLFGWTVPMLGEGTVGGPLLPLEGLGREIAIAADRVLSGEPPGAVGRRVVAPEAPAYDARELRRWGIPEDRLPRGSRVLFRPPTFFAQYRARILAAAALLVLQGAAILALAEGRRRERRAAEEAAELRHELAHAGRVSVLGQLSSSIAHELSQPLGAILRNAEAAELVLSRPSPDLGELRAIVTDVKADDLRARDVIDRMRSFLKRRELWRAPVDPAALVEGVVALLEPDARNRGVRIGTELERELPAVTGDQVHLQQVLLNLVVNAMEAMDSLPREERAVTVSARSSAEGGIEIAVEDAGPGIPRSERGRVFEPFHTTKPKGMGMGLPICRSIVEAHGGTIRVAEARGRGATIVVTLPGGSDPA